MEPSRRILIIEDEVRLGEAIQGYLRGHGYRVERVADGAAGVAKLGQAQYDLVITDLMLPGLLDGFDIMKHLRESHVETCVIVISAYETAALAIEALRLGAKEYLIKPFGMELLRSRIGSILGEPPAGAQKSHEGAEEDIVLRDAAHLDVHVAKQDEALGPVFASKKLGKVKQVVRCAAKTSAPVLLEGESGVGKDLIAKWIHSLSNRATGPFVKINCAAVPDQLLESELFGYEKGAFTGATESRKGKLELGQKGTVYLNEIGDMPINLQAKLLQFCQEGTFYHLGGKVELAVDVRIIAATNADIQSLLESDRFRKDLYYRLNVINIHIPPLRERVEDIMVLAQHFLCKYRVVYRSRRKELSPQMAKMMTTYHWPGNVRELENFVQRILIFDNEKLGIEYLQQGSGDQGTDGIGDLPWNGISLKEMSRAAAKKAEREAIIEALRRTKGNKWQAAKLLRVSYRALLYKTKEMGSLGL